MGINTGILHNAEPLTATRIAELEREVLEGGKSYAYLDQAGKLCFAMQRGVDGIKDLAWNNAYELTNAGSILTKRAYKKTGLKTFVLDSTYTKPSLNASWTVGEIPIFEFDGSIEGRPYVYSDRHDAMLVKVSDSVLTSQMLLGSTLTYITGEHGADVENTVLLDNTEYVYSIIGDNGTEEGCLVETIDGSHIVSVNNSWLLPDFLDWDIELEPGTYFMVYSSEAAEAYGFSKVYTKSISCLTIADATNPTTTTAERLEGDGQEFYTLAPTPLTFRSTAPLSELQEVQVNGVTVDPSSYTTEEGSTIVTFSIDYLKTLNVDNYEVTVVSDSKAVGGGFSVVAPELNEYGFYYNQPYTAYVEYFGENESVFIRENGTLDIIGTPSGSVSQATYSIDGDAITIVSPIAGTFTGIISENGAEIFINELVTNFTLGSEEAVADEDYIYTYESDLGGYEVTVIDKTKASYGAIKTGINGIPTVKLADLMFYNNLNIVTAPQIPDTVSIIGEVAFRYCTSLTSITIPGSVTSISASAFSNCSSLTSITIPDSVTSIGDSAFSHCSSLTSINIPNGVTFIDGWAFCHCRSLADIAIPNSVTLIGTAAFSHCTSLTSVIIGDGVTSIDEGAFEYCEKLTSINIPDSVTSIGSYAFEYCKSLTSIIFEGTIAQWNAISRGNAWNSNVPATYVQCTDGQVAL